MTFFAVFIAAQVSGSIAPSRIHMTEERFHSYLKNIIYLGILCAAALSVLCLVFSYSTFALAANRTRNDASPFDTGIWLCTEHLLYHILDTDQEAQTTDRVFNPGCGHNNSYGTCIGIKYSERKVLG